MEDTKFLLFAGCYIALDSLQINFSMCDKPEQISLFELNCKE